MEDLTNLKNLHNQIKEFKEVKGRNPFILMNPEYYKYLGYGADIPTAGNSYIDKSKPDIAGARVVRSNDLKYDEYFLL